MRKKRFLSWLLTLCLLLGMFSFPAYAEGNNTTTTISGDGTADQTGTMTITLVIPASTPDAPAAPTKASATKNSITLNEVSGCEYSKDGANWQGGTEFTGLMPGTEYTFYQRVKATANTNASAASSASFSTEADTYAMTITLTIVDKEAAVITKAPTARTLTYTGDQQELVTAGTASGGTMKYAVTTANQEPDDEAYTFDNTSIPTATEAGTYHVWYKAVGDDTHNDSTPVCVDVTINKAASEPKEVNANNWIYDGTTHELVTINQSQLQKKITLLKTVSSLVPYNIRISEEKVATDDKEAIDTIDESKSEEQKVEEVVENQDTSDESKAETEETKSDSQQPESQEVVEEEDTNEQVENIESENSGQNNSGLSEEIIIQNSLVLDDALTTTDSDVDTESVQKDDNNSEETNDQEGDKTVSVEETNDDEVETENTDTEVVDSTDKSTEETQQESKVIAEEKTNVTRNRMLNSVRLLQQVQDVQEEGPVLKFVVSDNNESAPSEGWSEEIPQGKDAGIYYVWYKVFGDSNHKDSEAACVTVTVSKATATIKVKDKTIYVGDTVPALDGSDCYTVTDLCGEDTLTAVPTLAYQKSGEVVSPDSSKAGEYDIVASGADAGDNYNITYEKGKLTISETAKADADIVPSEDAPSILPTKPEISNELAEQAAKIAEADGSKVELKLTVKADEESKVSESTVLNQKPQMKLQVQSQFKDEDTVKVDVVDIDIKQIINGSDKGTLTETNAVLEIGIGYDFTGKYDPVVVREHNGTSQAFRALDVRPSSGNYVDGTFFADTANNKLYIYSRLFSQYVIAYSTVEGNAQNRVASTTSSSSSKTPEVSTVPVYRLFNAKIGYHFFTANVAEKNALVAAGWTDEGIAWQVQPKAGKPVYRMFDKTRGMHAFTADATEKATLIAAGAVDEGIAWYGHEAGRTVYKVTNPKVNKVLYTTSVAEKDALAATGFTVEEANFKVN